MTKKIFFCALIWLALGTVAFAESAGSVIGVKPDSFAVRGSGEIELALKDAVEASDALRTGGTGRLEVLFSDDSSLKLGPNTVVQVVEFLPEGAAPKMRTHVGEGVARFITGQISEQNPDGFVITTPEATIGVRGTVGNVIVGNGYTILQTMSGETTLNGVAIASGMQGVVGSGGTVQITPLSTTEMQSAANIQTPDDSEEENPVFEVAAMPGSDGTTDLAMIDKSSDLLAGNLVAGADSAKTHGVISGTLTATGSGLSSGSGTYGFTFNLATGEMSNGWAQGTFTSSTGAVSGTLDATGHSGEWLPSVSKFHMRLAGTWAGQDLGYVGANWVAVRFPSGLPEVGTNVLATEFQLSTDSDTNPGGDYVYGFDATGTLMTGSRTE